ncbi:uncharacterized protein CLUP02_10786 [Colletotrichum lupini]|uniref:Uncharacterized protein n=1 Tax=Colletotrichum lupini TaxID=145971 RepID=A0A9Q8SX86_9PEZI|nr:uncharacterized protein CLUP02_10786 [Colletotrichum lupini]UQC85289.1 hypothetical protein CLUP02_10786 [Colletotrichum lupini]
MSTNFGKDAVAHRMTVLCRELIGPEISFGQGHFTCQSAQQGDDHQPCHISVFSLANHGPGAAFLNVLPLGNLDINLQCKRRFNITLQHVVTAVCTFMSPQIHFPRLVYFDKSNIVLACLLIGASNVLLGRSHSRLDLLANPSCRLEVFYAQLPASAYLHTCSTVFAWQKFIPICGTITWPIPVKSTNRMRLRRRDRVDYELEFFNAQNSGRPSFGPKGHSTKAECEQVFVQSTYKIQPTSNRVSTKRTIATASKLFCWPSTIYIAHCANHTWFFALFATEEAESHPTGISHSVTPWYVTLESSSAQLSALCTNQHKLLNHPTASPQRAKGPNHYGSTKQPTECQPWVVLKEENFVIILHSSGTRYIYANARKTAKSPFPTNLPAHRMERPGGDGATKAQSHRQAGCASSTRTRATLGPVHQETAPVFQNKLVEVLLSPHMTANLTRTIRNTNTEGPHHGKPQSESAPRLDRNSSPSSLPPRAGGGYSGHLSVTGSCLKHNALKGSGSWEGQVSHTLHSSASCLPKRDPFALAAHLQDKCGKRETRKEEKRTLVFPTLAFRRFCLAFRRVSSLTTSNELEPNGDRRNIPSACQPVTSESTWVRSKFPPSSLQVSLTDIKSLRFIRAGSGRDAVGHPFLRLLALIKGKRFSNGVCASPKAGCERASLPFCTRRISNRHPRIMYGDFSTRWLPRTVMNLALTPGHGTNQTRSPLTKRSPPYSGRKVAPLTPLVGGRSLPTTSAAQPSRVSNFATEHAKPKKRLHSVLMALDSSPTNPHRSSLRSCNSTVAVNILISRVFYTQDIQIRMHELGCHAAFHLYNATPQEGNRSRRTSLASKHDLIWEKR